MSNCFELELNPILLLSVTCKLLDQSSNPNDDTQREFRLVAVMAT
jgi:hypothetical protein